MVQGQKKKGKLLWILLAALIVLLGAAAALILTMGDFQAEEPEKAEELYWNVDRAAYAQGSATGMSSRKADEDGVFRVRFLHNGKLEEIPISDKRLVNKIDTKDAMGLVLDENGVAIEMIDVKKVAKELAMKSFVKEVKGDTVYANASIAFNGMNHMLKVTENVKIFDADPNSETLGKELTLADIHFTDAVVAFGNLEGELKWIFRVALADESPIFWRMGEYRANGETTRVPSADGVYTLQFASEGKIVELSTKDKALVDQIDTTGYLNPFFAFKFDADGYISGILATQAGKFGMMACMRLEVHKLDGRTFTAEGMWSEDQGLTYSATLPEGCPIYDVSEAALREGRFGQEVDSLQMHDRITVWTDVSGVPQFVYIQNRLVGPGYYVYPHTMRAKDSMETTREPNSKGWYEIQLIKNGEVGIKTYKTKDRELVNYLDQQGSNGVCGLKTDGDIITQVYSSQSVYGYAAYYRGYTVTNILGNLVTIASGSDSTTLILADGCKVYDVSGANEFGTEVELQVGDRIESHRDLSFKIQCVYVTRRVLGEKTLYFNVGNAQYDAKKQETARQKDEKGYYVYEMFNYKGQKVTLKTKSKDIATQVDAQSTLCMCLVVEKGIIKRVLGAEFAYGKFVTSGLMVKKLNSDGTVELVSTTSDYKLTFPRASDMKVYNFSYIFEKNRGEKVSKLKVGDVIACFADINDNIKMCWIRLKMMPDLLYPVQRTSTEIPVPDAEGWYTVQAMKDGKVVEYKTKDLAIVNEINTKTGVFTVYAKDGEIKSVLGEGQIQGVTPQLGRMGWEVVSISGKKVTFQYKFPDEEIYGEKVKLTIDSKTKIYDISPDAETYGAATKLQKGDTVLAYKDPATSKTLYVFVKHRANRTGGVEAYCEHCGTEVRWMPWFGGTMGPGHYYLSGDGVYSGAQSYVGASGSDYEAVLDLNGRKLTVCDTRGFKVESNETLTIIDTVGGGEIASTGTAGADGAVALISGGNLNLFSGTLRLIESQNNAPKYGGVLAIQGGKFNMYGGQIIGGQLAEGGQGGSLYVSNSSVVNIYNGTISGGKAAYGGNVRVANASQFNLLGGAVTGGSVTGQGGNFSLVGIDSTLTVTAGEITGGSAQQQGGNVYCNSATILNIAGGTISGGITEASNGGNLALDGATLNLTEGAVADGNARLGGNIYLFGGAIANVSGGSVTGGTALDGGSVRMESKSQFNLTGGTVSGGTASSQGGNFSVKHEETLLNIAGGEITGGTAKNQGGNIYAESCQVKLADGTVSGGTSTDSHGGNLAMFGATLDMTSGMITGGKANQGGNLFLSGATVNVADGTISGGNAAYGGNVRMTDATVFTISGGAITGGTVTGQGGNFSLLGANTILNLTGGEISGGSATGHGGNIYCNTNTTVNISGGAVSGGSAPTSNGGNLALDSATLNITEGTISGGNARLGGNIYLFAGAVANMTGGTVTDGTALDGGSARMESSSQFTISGGVITKGIASGQGGNFSVKAGCTLNVAGGEITGGTSTSQGGNIYTEDCTVNISGGIISGGTTANSYGGNLCHYNTALTITDGTIADGSAYVGGNIYLFGGSVVNMSGGTLSGGTAVDGGAVRIQGASQFTLSGGTVTGGTATSQGGNFCLKETGSSLTITDGIVTGGTSRYQGGNVYANPGTVVTMEGGSITDGASTESYGGNVALDNATFNMTAGTVSGGTGVSGGNVYPFNGAVTNITGGEITGGFDNVVSG